MISRIHEQAANQAHEQGPVTVSYTHLFVAGEAFVSSACNEDPSLIEYALDKGVLITGPLTLISLLRTFAMGWQAVRQEENAKRIATIGRVLYERALKFSEHLVEVGKHLERSVNAFNGAVGSYAVSYTHLDVYKRQFQNRLHFIFSEAGGLRLCAA